MIFTAERAPFLAAMAAISTIIPKKVIIPILSHVRLSADLNEQVVTLTGTDLEMSATIKISARVTAAGATTVNGDRLHSILRALPEGADLEFKADGDDVGRAALKSGRSNFKLGKLPPEDFPEMRAGAYEATHAFKPAALIRLLEIGAMCIEQDEPRHYFRGGLLHTVGAGDGQKLRLTSTDGHRLVWCEVPAENGDVFQLLIAKKTIQAAQRLLANVGEDEAVIAHTGNLVVMELGPATLTSKLLSAEGFPVEGCERMASQPRGGRIQVDTDLMIGALRRVLIMAPEGALARRTYFSARNEEIAIRATDTNNETAQDEVSATTEGADIDTAFVGTWFAQFLDHIRTEEVIIEHTPAPLLIRETGNTDWLAVLHVQGVK